MSQTVPLTISPEAAAYVVENGLQEPFQKILDEIPKRMTNVLGITVTLEYIHHLVDDFVVVEVVREQYDSEGGPRSRAWIDWKMQALPPQVFRNLMIVQGLPPPPHAG